MIFDDQYHLHVGYYENGHDLEGIMMKLVDEEKWCLFFDDQYDHIPINRHDYQWYEGFGLLVREYEISDMNYEMGSRLFMEFLKENKIIQD
jgi:hypothetical protein